MRRAVGEGVEPSQSGYAVASVSHSLRHRDEEVCLPKFHHPTVYKFTPVNLLLGKDSNLHRVVSLYRFPMISATGTRRCVCQKFHHPTLYFFLKNNKLLSIAYTNLTEISIPCKYFNKNILFLFKF